MLLPPPVATEVDGLRRACGDPALDRVPPHVTLVPPVNVRVEHVAEVLGVLRAAAEVRPFRIGLGPVTTFAPVTPTIHLAVDDPSGGLARLHERCRRGPLDRPLDHDFVPHATLSQDADRPRIDAALVALDGYVAEVDVDVVHLMEEQRDDDGARRWVPVADVPFGPARLVGRGGFEVLLVASRLVDPEACAALGLATRVPCPAGADPLVVVARHDGAVVGARTGWTRDGVASVATEVVAADDVWAREAVAGHLAAAFGSAAAERGCEPEPNGG